MKPFDSFDKKDLHIIKSKDYQLALVNYPVWKGYVAANDTDIWIEVIPQIDINEKTIKISDEEQKSQQGIFFTDEKKVDEGTNEKQIKETIDKILLSVPNDIVELVKPFPDSHWEIIKAVILIGEDFKNLLKSNPALAYLIVNMDKLNPSFIFYSNINLLQRMIREKRKEILRLCGFPDEQSLVKIFSKISPNALSLKSLLAFRIILMSNDVNKERILQLLSFAKKINGNLIHLINFQTELLFILSDRVIFELIEDENYSQKVKVIKQMSQLSKKWRIQFPTNLNLDNLSEAKKKLDEKVKLKKAKLNIFPLQPIKDNDYIKAITTQSELTSWSKRQQNCVRSYARKVRSGECYIYKINYKGEEATLEIKESSNGSFKISELKGFRNAEVSPKLNSMVKKWLDDAK